MEQLVIILALLEVFYISDCEIKYSRGYGIPEVIKY